MIVNIFEQADGNYRIDFKESEDISYFTTYTKTDNLDEARLIKKFILTHGFEREIE